MTVDRDGLFVDGLREHNLDSWYALPMSTRRGLSEGYVKRLEKERVKAEAKAKRDAGPVRKI